MSFFVIVIMKDTIFNLTDISRPQILSQILLQFDPTGFNNSKTWRQKLVWNIFCAILKRLSLFSFSLVSALVCNFFATRSFMYMVCSKFLFKAESRFKQVYIGKIFSFLFLCLKDSFHNRYKLLSARCISGLYTLLYLIVVGVIFQWSK